MASSFYLTTIAAAIGFFTLLRKLRFHQDNQEKKSSSLSPSSSSTSSLSPSSVPSPALSCIWTHQAFPSFRGEDVRRDFLSHIHMEFQRMGITPFIDNEIKRGESIGPELTRAIRGSKIAIILLSRNYASSKWCLDELVEIMKCREELGQTVMAVFHKVDPSDVKKLTGDFGKVFRKTCAGKSKQDIGRWRQALAEVAKIAGYHSSNWDNEAAMIKKIATDISNIMINSTPSSDFDGLVGMRAHLEKMEPLLRLESDEVRIIGIWGPPGIGKTTIARVVYNQFSNSFQLSVFIENKEALQIFCMYAFGQNSPKDGFKKLAWKVTNLAGNLPLGLRIMGSYFRGMSKEEWKKSLPRLETSLDADIQSILKFSYDALDEEDKDLFLHIACLFNNQEIQRVEEYLANSFLEVRQRLNVLTEKSLISFSWGRISMHSLLEKLGRDIVRKQSIQKHGHRQFLLERREICEVLTGDATGSISVKGIDFYDSGIGEELDVSERAFEGMSNLQFLRFHGKLQLPRGLKFLSRKLQMLQWSNFPMTCLPSIVNVEFLVELNMRHSKLEKLWEGDKPLRNLKYMDLSYSINLKELPDLSTATNLVDLYLRKCSSLVKLPSSIGYTNNLQKVDLRDCSSLIKLPCCFGNAINLVMFFLSGCSGLLEFPSFIGNVTDLQILDLSSFSNLLELPSFICNATNLKELNLSDCSNLVELPLAIGNLQKLQMLTLGGCSKLEVLPTNVNLISLQVLDLTDCSMLKIFPEISTNIGSLTIRGTAIREVPPSISSWPRLDWLHMSYFENLKEFPHALDSITCLCLSNTEIQEVPTWVKSMPRLFRLMLKGCRKLVSLPQLPDSLNLIDAENCESLERLDCCFRNPMINFRFGRCFKLDQEARDLIIQTLTTGQAILPGGEVPRYFTHRATSGGPLTIKLTERPLPTSVRFKACFFLVHNGDDWVGDGEDQQSNILHVRYRESMRSIDPVLTEHLHIFEIEEEVTSSELVFEFKLENRNDWKIGKCGLRQLVVEVPS